MVLRRLPWLSVNALHGHLSETLRSFASSPAERLADAPSLQDFMAQRAAKARSVYGAAAPATASSAHARSVYIKTYGCQMNVSDTELVRSILIDNGYTMVEREAGADVVLLNTCAIREKAEAKIWGKLRLIQHQAGSQLMAAGLPSSGGAAALQQGADTVGRGSDASGRRTQVVGLLGCMAERLKDSLLESGLVQVIAGPDAYRDLPRLLRDIQGGQDNAMNVQLSLDETYADIAPVRPEGTHAAFVSITRGCNNMCSFCIVPRTRGRERSRPADSILDEVKRLRDAGVRQVTLLGQNVNSYADFSNAVTLAQPGSAQSSATGLPDADKFSAYAQGFQSVYTPRRDGAVVFSDLLSRVASVDPEMRVRFTSPHPKDFGDDCLDTIAAHTNICRHLHMPAQSGSSTVLARMRRGYTRDAYDALIERARAVLPGATFSTDIIVGFCGETDPEHRATLDLLERTAFSQGFLFAYSRRERTHAARKYADDVPAAVKSARLAEAMAVYKAGALQRRRELAGTSQLVLVEEAEARDGGVHCAGRTEGFAKVHFDVSSPLSACAGSGLTADRGEGRLPKAGDYVAVQVRLDEKDRLVGAPLGFSGIADFASRPAAPAHQVHARPRFAPSLGSVGGQCSAQA